MKENLVVILAPTFVLLFVAAILLILWKISGTWRLINARSRRIRREAAQINTKVYAMEDARQYSRSKRRFKL